MAIYMSFIFHLYTRPRNGINLFLDYKSIFNLLSNLVNLY